MCTSLILYSLTGKSAAWKLTKKELRFPISTSEVSYRCCADSDFRYMNEEGPS
jgi:hypothetical protein